MPTRPLRLIATVLLAALILARPGFAAPPPGLEPVGQLVVAPLSAHGSVGAVRVGFDAFGRRFELALRPARGAGGEIVYRGRVLGAPGSRAWLAPRGGALEGMVNVRGLRFALAPALRFDAAAAPGANVAYRVGAAAAPPSGSGAGRGTDDRSSVPPASAGDGDGAHETSARAAAGRRERGGGAALAAGDGALAGAAQALTLNHNALAALGQENLVYADLNQPGATGLYYPYDVARDASASQTRLYVADTMNSRVLGFECAGASCALATATAASRVFGQPDFAGALRNGGLLGQVSPTTMSLPQSVAVDGAGTLYVADTENNRVLVFLTPWIDASADVAIGQTSLFNSSAGSGLNQLRQPQGVFVDGSGALWVADTGNNRVLRFATITTGASASFAIGGSGAASASTLSAPRGVFVDGAGNLYVADTGFSRVLRYAPPLTAGKSATSVFGHGGSFTNGSANQGGVSASSLASPEKLFVDGGGRLWVADTANNRVLEYDTPLTNQTANRVFAQVDRTPVATFTTAIHDAPDGFVNNASTWGPRGLTVDANGTLWVCDRDNSRVLGFDSPLGGAPASLLADRLLGKPTFVDASANVPSALRMNNPVGLAVDTSESPNRLWVVDIGNNRVLGYDSTADINSNRAADRVLGQASFTSGATNAGINPPFQHAVNAVGSSTSLFFPFGVAVDSLGGVYVADGSNSRVLHFEDPFAGDSTADRVFGQANFSDRNPSFPYGTASSLAGVFGVSVGAGDDLWVGDRLSHRVVRFADAPNQPATGAAANLVLGQAGFVSSNTFPPYAPGCAANRMNTPAGVHAAASGRLYAADEMNNRVLVFSPPFSNGMNASAVFGQANFTSCAANRGGGVGASTLFQPQAAYEDSAGNVFIADYGNHRVLVYYTPFAGGDFVADDVLGQANLTSAAVVGPRPDTLLHPADVTMDGSGRLFVADREHSRITRYAVNAPPQVVLDPLPNPVVVGQFLALTGSGFTAGSVVKFFVATANGPVAFGPYTPDSWSSGILYLYVDPTMPLGDGFVSLLVINTDQGFITSQPQSQLLFGDPSVNLPSIRKINGQDLRPLDPSIPVANVETVAPQGSTLTIEGTGFNNPLVNVFTAAGNVGPLVPHAGGSSTLLEVDIPLNAPTGPGSFQVVNNPFTGNVHSNAVSVPIGELLSLTSVMQNGNTMTVNGTGFSTLSVINFFNRGAGGVVSNLGGLDANGAKIPLNVVSSSLFTFTVPAGAVSGASFVQVLNPPYIPYSSTSNDPDGAFTLVVP